MNIRALVATLSQYSLSHPEATVSVGELGIVIKDRFMISGEKVVGTIAIKREADNERCD